MRRKFRRQAPQSLGSVITNSRSDLRGRLARRPHLRFLHGRCSRVFPFSSRLRCRRSVDVGWSVGDVGEWDAAQALFPARVVEFV